MPIQYLTNFPCPAPRIPVRWARMVIWYYLDILAPM
ncbi:predicted protein [Botrytis cinerea T4]|uniref:Uncharacterized protein n=1 Tax=Botryotinia fuckeliana (strain T4) TaxID=999810 RepID=G2XN44_BOTF4|nr:predicted protein [Botrytis cinerea T4]